MKRLSILSGATTLEAGKEADFKVDAGAEL